MSKEPFCIYRGEHGQFRLDTAAFGEKQSKANFRHARITESPMSYAKVLDVVAALDKEFESFKKGHTLLQEGSPLVKEESFFFIQSPSGDVEPGTAHHHPQGAKNALCDVPWQQIESAWAPKEAAGYSLKKLTVTYTTSINVQDA
jgi:hypothetical protein